MTISPRLKSRKLWAFVVSFLVVVANSLFDLKLPEQSLLYLLGLSASYILGQGYVDAKQQPSTVLPVGDVTDAVSNLLQTELVKFKTPIPVDDIMAGVKVILNDSLSKMNTVVFAPISPAVIPTPIVTPEVTAPASNVPSNASEDTPAPIPV